MDAYPNASSYSDRHGKVRWRYRRGKLNIGLRGAPGDATFDACYRAAVERSAPPKPPPIPRQPGAPSERKRPKLSPRGVVYVLQVDEAGPIKIGFAVVATLMRRIAALQTGNPNVLRIIARAEGYQRHERLAHAALAKARLSGEWFAWCDSTRAFVGALPEGIDAALDAAGRPHHSRPSLASRAKVVVANQVSNLAV